MDRCALCGASLGAGDRPGELAPMQRAERDLARVRPAARDGDPAAAAAAFTLAIAGLRQHSTPTISLTGCLITPGTCYAWTMRRPPGPRSAKLVTSLSGWAASRCWAAPLTSAAQNRGSGPRW
ncbi:MAG TPA: hypothetical protein VJ418_29690 [Streptosporangiaceae bacterium]|nr:hypothetical protein [Streptosporangiaceae bacterium]